MPRCCSSARGTRWCARTPSPRPRCGRCELQPSRPRSTRRALATRTDRWGGTVEGRLRFAVEVARRSAARIGGDRVGIRISPYGVFNDMRPDADMDALYASLATELSAIGLAYVHVVDHSSMGAPKVPDAIKATIRANFTGVYLLSGGYDRARAEADLAAGLGELVAFGRPFIANPRLPTALPENATLKAADYATFYTPGPAGYSDYA